MPLSPGDHFDRYVIEGLLGEGGMARVYRAHDPRLRRRVALKVLRVDPAAEPGSADAATRMLREARAAAALDHPNAVSVFDVGEADGAVFLAMELVVGKSLRAFVSDGAVPWETKLRWMLDAARALGAAHDSGLVHRDVKPENVMVRDDGVVKVLDFGIATRVAVPGGLDELLTQSTQGGFFGTPRYQSPEQLRGEAVDARADQFSWGVTAYELLTGTLPWPSGRNGFQLVLAVLNEVAEPPSKRRGALPAIVDATILKTLSKAASQRFDSMEAVVVALEGLPMASSRRSWAETPAATSRTEPAPPMPEALEEPPPAPSRPPPAPPLEAVTTLAEPRRPSAPPLRRALATLGLASAGIAAVLVARLFAGEPGSAVAAAAAAPSASVGPAPTAITALPPPRSRVPEAVEAYASFRQSFRDADWEAAMRALETAAARDPALGAAHLRLAFLRSLEVYQEGRVRPSFHAAVASRAGMDERDAALLDALEPYLQREPSEPGECIARLAALRARWPGDAEIAYMLGSVRYDWGDLAGAMEAFDAALAVDPGFALALSSKGGCLTYLGRFDEASAAFEEALRLSRTATEPLWYLAELAGQRGACAEEERLARRWLARDPDDAFAYELLASALAGEGKPIDAIRTALEQKWARLPPARRAVREPVDRAELDLMVGDFAAAERRLSDLEGVLAAEPGAQAHAESQLRLLRLAQESGRDDRAGEVATSYLARKDAWSPPHRVDDPSIFLDPTPEMLAARARAGSLTASRADELRREWVARWRTKTSTAYLGHLWVAAWAIPATTREQALAALEVLPELGGVPPFTPDLSMAAHVGRVYLLADRLAEAVPALEQGAASCTVLGETVANTRSFMGLGLARQAQGDRAGACAAYAMVLSRWGHARPRSVTADEARTRAAALGCR